MYTATFSIIGGDYAVGGAASKDLKEMLKRLGVEPKAVRKTMIAAYEAEMNVVIHASRGTMKVAVDPSQVEVVVADEGPGISDIGRAMKEGFSTAPAAARELGFGAGMGLPNIKKNSDRFSIHSTVGQGTLLRFTIQLQAEQAVDFATNSIHIEAARCRQCLMCVRGCPTGAVRVRDGEPRILNHLCVDCTSCIAACEVGALKVEYVGGELFPAHADTVLVLPASFTQQFGGGIGIPHLLDALHEMGFQNVRLGDEWERALQTAVLAYADQCVSAHPVLSPVCPAVLNLIQVRFPSLLGHVAPYLTPFEAAREELTGPHVIFVGVCPSQQSILRAPSVMTKIEILDPNVLRNEILGRISRYSRKPPDWKMLLYDDARHAEGIPESRGIIQVSGMGHVMKILDKVENRLLDDCTVLELYACDQGCFGAPIWSEDAFVARSRWRRGLGRPSARAQAVQRTAPLQPRAGLRLDSDMIKAIEKLARMDALTRSLPGRDCAVCGAPGCAALAEDVVLERAEISACLYR